MNLASEKTEKNPKDQQYHQKHLLMAIVMKILLMWIKFVCIKKNKWDVKYVQIATAPTKSATENIGESLC